MLHTVLLIAFSDHSQMMCYFRLLTAKALIHLSVVVTAELECTTQVQKPGRELRKTMA